MLALGGLALASLAWIGQPAAVSGRVTMLDKGDRRATMWARRSSGSAVRRRSRARRCEPRSAPADKEFSPHVLVVPVGSTVSFPNHDPFNHNVFSLSEENPFDLGLYGRDEVRRCGSSEPASSGSTATSTRR